MLEWNSSVTENLKLVGVPQEERERVRKNIQRNNCWKHPKFIENSSLHTQKAWQTPSRLTHKENKQTCHSEKRLKVKDKDKVLKTAREKFLITYKGTPLRFTAHFSAETKEARK